MSLDVYLKISGAKVPGGTGIFIRENGSTREITREEWDARFPGKEPIRYVGEDDDCVYDANITHNLNRMADEAGIYQHLWKPDEIGIAKATELIGPLEDGLRTLKEHPDKFRAFDPSNGWGDYEGLVQFVENYLEACQRYPEAAVSVSR